MTVPKRHPATADPAGRVASEWQQTFDAVTDIVALISPEHRLMRVNRAGCRALGKTEAELIGKKCYRVVHRRNNPIPDCPCSAMLESRRPLSGEFSEAGRHFIATASPILDRRGRLLAFAHTVKDITERKRMEDELVRHRNRLAELVEERTRELKAAQQQALRQTELAAIGRVAGSLAREMRGPIDAIRDGVYRLRRSLPPEFRGEVNRRFASVGREMDRLDFTLEALLDFVRRGRPRPARVKLRTLLSRALEQAGLPDSVSVHFHVPAALPPVLADEHRMVAVFANLVANAAQAMPDGGAIGIFAARQKDKVAVAVSDTGTGISARMRKRLFEPLFSTSEHRAGLGLAVSRAFVEADRGAITITTRPGKGTTVVVTLPVAR